MILKKGSGTPQLPYLYKRLFLHQSFIMSESLLKGNVSFVNHEKKYILIEYEQNGKKKAVNGSIDEKLVKRSHRFQIGDTINFKIKLSGRGDRMMALDIQYLYNTGLDMLINKARTENNFTGYLKIVDDKYFVKEIDTYLFFPAPFAPWQIRPTEAELNEAVTFALEDLDKKDKITASLYNKKFIPEYYSAVKAFKTKAPVEAVVYKISPHGIYLNLFGEKIQAKLPNDLLNNIKTGDQLNVLITYLGGSRIIVEEFK